MNKKTKIILLIIIILLILIDCHLIRNYVILTNIYADFSRFINYNDNYKLTTIPYTLLDEGNTKHSIYEEYTKDNIFMIKWEFTPEYTKETKDLNFTSIYWKDTETEENIQYTLDSNNVLLAENRTTWGENVSNKSIFTFGTELSKKDFISNNYWNNIFNFFSKKDGFYTIYIQNGNYIKIRILDNVCEINQYNNDHPEYISLEQKIELDVVTDEDIKKFEQK